MLFPARCACCGMLGASPCPACRRTLHPAAAGPTPVGVDRLVAVYAYRGGVRPLIGALKYRNNRACVPWAAAALAAAWHAHDLGGTLTWAPTSPARARRRGFDQSALLARALHRRLRRDGDGAGGVQGLLRRVPGPAQTGLLAAERGRVHFVARGPVPPSVVVLDDVVTTGATLAAAAAALRHAGAQRVDALVLARTPAPSRRHDAAGPPADAAPSPSGGSGWPSDGSCSGP